MRRVSRASGLPGGLKLPIGVWKRGTNANWVTLLLEEPCDVAQGERTEWCGNSKPVRAELVQARSINMLSLGKCATPVLINTLPRAC